MVDSLNLLGVTGVPITLLIDEYGIIRAIRPNDEDLSQFLSQDFGSRESVTFRSVATDEATLLDELETSAAGGNADEVRAYADALFLWRHPDGVSQAIDYYRKALELDPVSGRTHFRLGVALRRRYDSESRQQGDFLQAVKHWESALDTDPNQYIWRRRIQQYGPRLDKPYSFYDWVLTAREEIAVRGENPIALSVEPGGAEFARPDADSRGVGTDVKEPDPGTRIRRDIEGMIQVETIPVPNTSGGESCFRAHMIFYPALEKKVHWNNEADDMEIWVSPPEGWSVDKQYLVFQVPSAAVSDEVRRIEFELRGPVGFSGRESIPSYALYYVCEDEDGICLYRRQDILMEVEKK